ncbi:hypothetical protein CFE70_004307 [Pyrenophora teres f. teres 0-1]
MASFPRILRSASSLSTKNSNKETPPESPTPAISTYNDPESKPEPTFLTWESPSDPANPFNFSLSKKWRTTLLACFMTFVVQVSGTMFTSAAEQINASFNVSDEKFPHSYWPVLSWNLGGAAAPMLGLPLMENFGVRWSYLALAQNFATLIVTRIITGSCTGVLANITSGIVSDMWRAGRANSFSTSLYIFALLAGLNMGPVFGSLVVKYTTWRWIFFGQIIFYSALIPILLFLLPEVRPDVILTQRARRIRASTAFMFTQSIVQVFSELYGWTFFGTGLVQSAVVVGELIGLVASLRLDYTSVYLLPSSD